MDSPTSPELILESPTQDEPTEHHTLATATHGCGRTSFALVLLHFCTFSGGVPWLESDRASHREAKSEKVSAKVFWRAKHQIWKAGVKDPPAKRNVGGVSLLYISSPSFWATSSCWTCKDVRWAKLQTAGEDIAKDSLLIADITSSKSGLFKFISCVQQPGKDDVSTYERYECVFLTCIRSVAHAVGAATGSGNWEVGYGFFATQRRRATWWQMPGPLWVQCSLGISPCCWLLLVFIHCAIGCNWIWLILHSLHSLKHKSCESVLKCDPIQDGPKLNFWLQPSLSQRLWRLWHCNFASCVILCLVSANSYIHWSRRKVNQSCHPHSFTHGICKVPSLNLVGEKGTFWIYFLGTGFWLGLTGFWCAKRIYLQLVLTGFCIDLYLQSIYL